MFGRLRRPWRVGAATWLARGLAVPAVGFGAVLLWAFAFGEGEVPWPERALGALITIVFVGAVAWPLRRGLFVDDEGVVIRGLFRTEHYSWESLLEIDTVRSGVEHLGRYTVVIPNRERLVRPGVTVLRLRLRDSSERVVEEVSSWMPFWFGAPPEEVAGKLERLRRCAVGEPSPPDSPERRQ